MWVYIQGGGYQTNSNANYNATEVVRQSGQNIVFVNFNYRVGLFGFLASEEIRDDGNLNVGILDQRKLLYWVQKYIKQVWLWRPPKLGYRNVGLIFQLYSLAVTPTTS